MEKNNISYTLHFSESNESLTLSEKELWDYHDLKYIMETLDDEETTEMTLFIVNKSDFLFIHDLLINFYKTGVNANTDFINRERIYDNLEKYYNFAEYSNSLLLTDCIGYFVMESYIINKGRYLDFIKDIYTDEELEIMKIQKKYFNNNGTFKYRKPQTVQHLKPINKYILENSVLNEDILFMNRELWKNYVNNFKFYPNPEHHPEDYQKLVKFYLDNDFLDMTVPYYKMNFIRDLFFESECFELLNIFLPKYSNLLIKLFKHYINSGTVPLSHNAKIMKYLRGDKILDSLNIDNINSDNEHMVYIKYISKYDTTGKYKSLIQKLVSRIVLHHDVYIKYYIKFDIICRVSQLSRKKINLILKHDAVKIFKTNHEIRLKLQNNPEAYHENLHDYAKNIKNEFVDRAVNIIAAGVRKKGNIEKYQDFIATNIEFLDVKAHLSDKFFIGSPVILKSFIFWINKIFKEDNKEKLGEILTVCPYALGLLSSHTVE
ncbi:MAG: hypothetical protein ACOCRK_02140 [bacterium]